MFVKIVKVDNSVEVHDLKDFEVPPIRLIHPNIVKVEVFSEGKKIISRKRKNLWWYKHITYNSVEVQNAIRQVEMQMQKEQMQEANNEPQM